MRALLAVLLLILPSILRANELPDKSVAPAAQGVGATTSAVGTVQSGEPRFRSDVARSVALPLSAVFHAVGSLISTGLVVGVTASQYACERSCRKDHAIGELALEAGVMTIFPAIPRFVVGDVTGPALYSVGILASIAIGKAMLDSGIRDANMTMAAGGLVLGFGTAAALGIVELAKTPHREDLEPSGRIHVVGATPLLDTHGAGFSVLGRF